MLKGIGWHSITSHDYDWDGRKRMGEHCLFQYTIAGQGEIEIQGVTYSLSPGTAFIADIPGDHRYCLPVTSSEWEVIYIEFSKDALPFWRQLLTMSEPVFQLPAQSELMDKAWNIYEMALDDRFQDMYQCSNFAYQFIMELSNYSAHQKAKPLPAMIDLCKQYIDSHYQEPIGLKEMAMAAKVSKFHLTREYERKMGVSPVGYLTEVRLTHAVKLLLSTSDNLERIAEQTGFSCANYFGKVFRKHKGISPGNYREKNMAYDIQRVFSKR
jgi:AraC-like DNA-binding protein